MAETLSVAEAKRRFSELIERVKRGERFLITRRGKPVVAVVPPTSELVEHPEPPLGLAAGAGALADWEEFEDVMKKVVAMRQKAKDRPVPPIE